MGRLGEKVAWWIGFELVFYGNVTTLRGRHGSYAPADQGTGLNQPGEPQMSTQNNASVKKHRGKNVEEGLARMEVTLSRKFIKQVREFARQRGMPFWYFVEQALVAYAAATSNAAETGNGK